MRLVVCLSVCRVPLPNSRTERHKIGRMEAHHTRNSWTHEPIYTSKRSKVSVTEPINVCHRMYVYLRFFGTERHTKFKLGVG